MKKSFLIVIGIVVGVFLSVSVSGQILTFEFSALGGSEASAVSNSNDANLTSSTITRGAGLTASANGGRFNATSWALTSIANAVSGNDYMEFTITPNSGYQFSVSSIVVQWQRSSTGNTAIALRSSVDSYSTDLDAVKSVTDNTSTQTFTWTFTQANSSTAVTYRLYSYAEATGGSGGPGDGSGNDIIVYGTVSASSSGPSITNISHTPVSPTSSDAVSVSADITDADGIAGAEIHWGTSSGSLGNTISMSNSGGDTYTTDTDIPAQSDGTTIYYEVYAMDNNTDETTSDEQSYTIICPSVSAPTATAATSVAGTSITANWNSVSGATGYELDVYSTGSGGSELVLNGGFETGDDTNWTKFETNYQVVSTDGSVTPHSGSYMLKCFATATRDLAQSIAITADGSTVYEISFWYRYESASDPEKLRIWSDFSLGHTGDGIQPTTYLAATDTWTKVTYTVTPDAGSNTLNLELRSYTDGKIYLDDISFKEIGGGTTYHLQNEDVGNTTSYSVTGLTPGETYYYVVRAYNACGSESANSNEITVNLSCSDPTTQASSLSFPDTQTNQMDVSWTSGDGDYRIVVASTSAIAGTPADNTSYTADANFGDGDILNAGEFIVYAGNGSSVTITGLSSDTEYFIKVFEYNCDGGSEQYLTSSPLADSETTIANIPAVTDFDVTCTTETTATLEWTNPSSGNWDGVAIAVRRGTNPPQVISGFAVPSALTVNTAFGNAASQYGDSPDYSYAIYKGTGTTVTVTGLTSGEDYVFKAFSYYDDGYDNTSAVTTTSITSLGLPEVTAASATTENSQTNISWTNPGCYDEILVVGHDGSSVSSNPSGDGSAYTANTTFGSGTDIGTNEFVVYKGTSTSVAVTGLTNGNSYYFTIFVRTGTEWSSGVEVIANPADVTTFIPGDMAIIAVNTNHTTIGEEFTFVAFKDITVGTSIDFTENGWEREYSDAWGTTEGTIRLTRIGNGTITAGTSITVVMHESNGYDASDFDIYVGGVDELAAGYWSISELNPTDGSGFNLNEFDDIWIMQGGSWIENTTGSNPAYHDDEYTGYVLYGWTATGWPGSDASGSTAFSNLYPACECFNTNVSGLANQDKVKYTGLMTNATKLEWIMRFNDEGNWTGYADDASYDAATPDYRGTGVTIGITNGGFESGRWTALQNTDWFDCGNWQNLTIPDEETNVVISTTYASDNAVVNNTENALCNNLTIESGIGLDFSNNTIEVHGSFNNQSASITSTNGTLLLASDDDVDITSNGASFYNVEVNGNGNFTLIDNLTLTGTLDLVDGLIETGSNQVFVNNSAEAAITNHSTASYINGNLRRAVAATGNYDLPVGDASNYQLANIDINSSTGLTYFDANFNNFSESLNISGLGLEVNGTTLQTLLDAGYWTISPNVGMSGVNYDIGLTMRGATNLGTEAGQHTVVKRANSSSDWILRGQHDNATQNINAGVMYAYRSNIDEFSDFAIAKHNNFILPVELISFTLDCNNNSNQLSWITASELNNDYFEVQRSYDIANWDIIAKIDGAGNSNKLLNYSFTDEKLNQKAYYRLKQVDFDGKFEYSQILASECSNSLGESIKIYPNPTSDNINILIENWNSETINLEIFDMMGRLIYSKNLNLFNCSTKESIDLSHFKSGIYMIRFTDNNTTQNIRIEKK
ncbi:MAG: T9SS type A sorting domain-containing protein [Bacteroidales bacterium]|nr:T9SS type A sorting domain-containing protein [Bacteroidales bacterium]